MSLLLLLAGVVLLYYGGDFLVSSASRLAAIFGLPPLVIGLTVVAFGTSSPELAATLSAAFRGSTDLALGNVIGSNIANVGLILGAAALLMPLAAGPTLLRRDVPFMVGVMALLLPFHWDGTLSRVEGAVFLGLLAMYLLLLLRQGKGGVVETEEELVAEVLTREVANHRSKVIWQCSAGVALGVALLVVGAQLLVQGGVEVARSFGVSEKVIGISLVAVGTSLPELASSLVAAVKKEADIVLGNVIGSNVFNVLAVLAVTMFLKPLPVVPEEVRVDAWVMLGFSVILPVLLLTSRRRLGRLEGVVLLVLYTAYMIFLFQ